MTLIELQDKLGEQIELITDGKIPFENRKRMADISQTVSSLAKQNDSRTGNMSLRTS